MTLYESRDKVGGNAKTHTWRNEVSEEAEAVSGLSVLAWPTKYFHNYIALLKELAIDSTEVVLPFAVRDEQVCDFFHDRDIDERLRPDVRRWMRLVNLVRRVNERLTGLTNPLFLSLRLISLSLSLNLTDALSLLPLASLSLSRLGFTSDCRCGLFPLRILPMEPIQRLAALSNLPSLRGVTDVLGHGGRPGVLQLLPHTQHPNASLLHSSSGR